jgi:hypothetical protein
MFAALDDGTIYIRDFRSDAEGLDPVWTGTLSDPSLIESLIADLPRGGDSTFGTSGGDSSTVIVTLDGEAISALHNPRFVPNDPDQARARELTLDIVYERLTRPEWWNSSDLLEEPLQRAALDTVVVFALEPRSRSSFNDDYQAKPYIEVPWPFERPAFECFFLQDPEAHDFVALLPAGDQRVLWILDEDLAFLTWSERWLLPYETPCEPDVPPLSARFDQ